MVPKRWFLSKSSYHSQISLPCFPYSTTSRALFSSGLESRSPSRCCQAFSCERRRTSFRWVTPLAPCWSGRFGADNPRRRQCGCTPRAPAPAPRAACEARCVDPSRLVSLWGGPCDRLPFVGDSLSSSAGQSKGSGKWRMKSPPRVLAKISSIILPKFSIPPS